MTIEYRNTLPPKDAFFALFESTGWNQEYKLASDALFEAVQRSWYMVGAYDGERLVGFGRILSDGILHALIVEMMVLPEYRGRHIGSTVLKHLVQACREHGVRDVQLFSARGKHGFYKKYGFVERAADAPGMELKD